MTSSSKDTGQNLSGDDISTSDYFKEQAKALSQANEQLAQSLANTHLLLQVSQSLIEIEKFDDALQRVVDLLADVLGYDRVSLITFDQAARQVSGYYRGGVEREALVPVSYEELWEGLSGWVMRERKPALSPKGQQDERESPTVQKRRAETHCGAIIVVPIQMQDQLLGTLTVINALQGRDFNQADVDMLMLLANQTAAAIENNRLYRRLVGEVAMRQRAQEELQQAHAALEKSVEIRTQELFRANRALRALSDCNQVLVRSQSEQDLMTQICQVLITTGGYQLAWIGYVEQDTNQSIRPVAWAGFEDGYLKTTEITWADTERGHGPTGTAARTRQVTVFRDIKNNSSFAPWRAQAILRGYESIIALPLLEEQECLGVLTIYSTQKEVFPNEEQQLLIELANDIVYGLAALRTRTARIHSEEQLKKSQANLEEAQAQACIGSWELEVETGVGDWGAAYWSKEMFRLFQRDPALGVPRPSEYLKLMHPDDRDLLITVNEHVAATGQAHTLVYRSNPVLGPQCYFQATIAADHGPDGQLLRMSGTVMDITARMQMEIALRERVKELTCLFEVSRLLEGGSSPETNSLYLEIAYLLVRAMQFPQDSAARIDMDGVCYTTSQYRPDLAHFLAADITVKNERRGRIEVYYTADLPFLIPEEQNLLLNVARMLGLWVERQQSINTLIMARQELEELNRSLERRVEERTAQFRQSRDDLSIANLALEKASRLKDEFLASMSHELRTPLTGILGLAEALQYPSYGGNLTEKQLKALKNIESSGRHLLDLINDILDLSKVEAGKLTLQIEPASITDICQASLQLIKGMANQKKLKVRFSMNTTSMILPVDARRLKQMLVNLLSNAVKFTPEGGSLGLEVDGDEVNRIARLTVWDEGIGIKTEDMDKLFKTFVQIDSSLSRQFSGTGMGLALAQRMAELHGGSVEVSSVFGEGSRFTILLPWPEQERGAPVKDARSPSEKDLEAIKNLIVIEDNSLDGEMVARYLNAIGIENLVHPLANGAVEQVAARRPNVVLLDLHLPDGSGLDVLAALKADERVRSIPVIVISVDERRTEAVALGAAGYLLKPFTAQELQTELARVASSSLESKRTVLVISSESAAPVVMLADDNEIVLDTLTDFLTAQHFQVVATRSGIELLEKVPEVHPDILLVDIQMPGMDGMETIGRLRAHPDPQVAGTPIVALTALAMTGDRERILQVGANEYVSKPASLTGLVQLILRLLDRKGPQARAAHKEEPS